LWLTATFNSGVMVLGLIKCHNLPVGPQCIYHYNNATWPKKVNQYQRLITDGRYKGTIVHSEGERSGCHSLTSCCSIPKCTNLYLWCQDVFGLLNSHDQELIIDHRVEIFEQNSPEEAGKLMRQDSVTAMNVSSIKCGNFLTSWGPVSFGKDSAPRSYIYIYIYMYGCVCVCMYVCKGTCYLWLSTKDPVVTVVADSHVFCFLGVSVVDILLITCIKEILHYMHPDLRC